LLLLEISLIASSDTCPKECFCSKDLTSVNCQGHHLVQVPSNIPKSTTKLYLDHNLIPAIHSSDFGILPNLRQLFLQNNKIQALEENAFNGNSFPNLAQLQLKDNLIKTIGKNAFKGLKSLEILYLTNNYITDVHKEAFTGTESIAHIYLESNELSRIPSLGQLKGLVDIFMSANHITDATFPDDYMELSKLQRIGLSNNKIQTLTNKTFRALQNASVTKLELSRNKINKIAPASFSPLLNLQSLYLGYNPLTASNLEEAIFGLQGKPLVSLNIVNISLGGVLPSSTFHLLKNSSIQRLFLRNNKIREIPSNIFTDLPHIQTLDLSGSGILTISDTAFHGLESLRFLFLNDNQLTTVPRNLPKSLQSLYLNGNQITALENDVFQNMSSLQNLYLGNNRIHTLHENAFGGLINLKKLHLVQNIIATLPGKVFQSLVHLESLELNKNSLTTIPDEPDVLSSMVSLQNLNLADNQLRTMPLEIFENLKSLLYLHLRGNNLGVLLARDETGMLFSGLSKLLILDLNSNSISMIYDNGFRDLVKMNELHLKGNVISGWGPHLFSHTLALSNLDMSNNRIAMVKHANVRNLNTLQKFYLSGNPFACTCDLRWFRDWINQTSVKIENVTSYKCNSPKEWSGKQLLQFDRTKINCLWYTKTEIIIAFAVGATVALIIVVSLIVFLYRKRWFIRLRFYRMQKWAKQKTHKDEGYEPLRGRNHVYDAFISYADDDYKWVMENILPGVDNGTLGTQEYGGKFKLYFDERDDAPGATILTNFVDNVDISRKVIIVLSKNYLKKRLNEFELEYTIMAESEGKIEEFILVLVEKLRVKDIPKILRRHVMQNKFIQWEDQEDAGDAFKEELTKKLEEVIETVQIA